MNETTPITMKDIAEALGVSVATVSRALKDSPRISAERREVIKKYAREHNFFPNFIAESLRKSRVQPMKIIGVIIPQFTHYYFSTILSGIEEEASARGYRLLVAQSNERYELDTSRSFSTWVFPLCSTTVYARGWKRRALWLTTTAELSMPYSTLSTLVVARWPSMVRL